MKHKKKIYCDNCKINFDTRERIKFCPYCHIPLIFKSLKGGKR
jgi:Zn finger protein HypA/HybF involved in hydrogenase expression